MKIILFYLVLSTSVLGHVHAASVTQTDPINQPDVDALTVNIAEQIEVFLDIQDQKIIAIEAAQSEILGCDRFIDSTKLSKAKRLDCSAKAAIRTGDAYKKAQTHLLEAKAGMTAYNQQLVNERAGYEEKVKAKQSELDLFDQDISKLAVGVDEVLDGLVNLSEFEITDVHINAANTVIDQINHLFVLQGNREFALGHFEQAKKNLDQAIPFIEAMIANTDRQIGATEFRIIEVDDYVTLIREVGLLQYQSDQFEHDLPKMEKLNGNLDLPKLSLNLAESGLVPPDPLKVPKVKSVSMDGLIETLKSLQAVLNDRGLQ